MIYIYIYILLWNGPYCMISTVHFGTFSKRTTLLLVFPHWCAGCWHELGKVIHYYLTMQHTNRVYTRLTAAKAKLTVISIPLQVPGWTNTLHHGVTWSLTNACCALFICSSNPAATVAVLKRDCWIFQLCEVGWLSSLWSVLSHSHKCCSVIPHHLTSCINLVWWGVFTCASWHPAFEDTSCHPLSTIKHTPLLTMTALLSFNRK